MIKMAPILIEFGDGDTGSQLGLTEEGEGCVALFNGEPGEIGREYVGEPPEGSVGAYIVFKNVESLDAVIGWLQKLRDAMVAEDTNGTEGTDDAVQPTKKAKNCANCKWYGMHECRRMDSCDLCPNYGVGICRCVTVENGEPCPYYEEWEGADDAT